MIACIDFLNKSMNHVKVGFESFSMSQLFKLMRMLFVDTTDFITLDQHDN